jgi:hypothetical protein
MPRFRVTIRPNGQGNPNQADAFDLGEIEAESHRDVVALLDSPLPDGKDNFCPADFDFDITPVDGGE